MLLVCHSANARDPRRLAVQRSELRSCTIYIAVLQCESIGPWRRQTCVGQAGETHRRRRPALIEDASMARSAPMFCNTLGPPERLLIVLRDRRDGAVGRPVLDVLEPLVEKMKVFVEQERRHQTSASVNGRCLRICSTGEANEWRRRGHLASSDRFGVICQQTRRVGASEVVEQIESLIGTMIPVRVRPLDGLPTYFARQKMASR